MLKRHSTIRVARRLALACVAVLATTAHDALARDPDGTFERTLPIDGAVRVEIGTGSGALTVRRGTGAQVKVTGRIELDRTFGGWRRDGAEIVRQFESDPPVTIAGNQVRIGPKAGAAYRDMFEHTTISFDVEVPAATEITASTGSGSIDVASIAGPVKASTGSGGIRLENVEGRAEVTTGSGSIRAHDIAGAITAHTGSGSIDLVQSGAGDVAITTGSGNAEATGVNGAVHARTGSGRIEISGIQNGAWDLETGSGSVVVDLPDAATFDLDAHTGSGSIETSHAVTVQGSLERDRLTGKAGGGGQSLRLRTGSGSIKID